MIVACKYAYDLCGSLGVEGILLPDIGGEWGLCHRLDERQLPTCNRNGNAINNSFHFRARTSGFSVLMDCWVTLVWMLMPSVSLLLSKEKIQTTKEVLHSRREESGFPLYTATLNVDRMENEEIIENTHYEKLLWKSALSLLLGGKSLFIWWFIMLLSDGSMCVFPSVSVHILYSAQYIWIWIVCHTTSICEYICKRFWIGRC